MSVDNTNKEEVHPGWLFGGSPNAIEAQEQRGQEDLVNSKQLPCQYSVDEDSKEFLKRYGISVLRKSIRDPLFYDVILPKNTFIRATEHSMWSELVQSKKVIASIFYKAAFYDRRAFIRSH